MDRGLQVRLVTGIVCIACVISFYFVATELSKLSIASFDVEETYPAANPFFRLRVNGYGVDGSTIWANGTVTWIGPANESITGPVQVSMYVYPKVGASKSVHVWMWTGISALPKDAVETRVETPPLGGEETPYPRLFNFRLSLTA